MYKCQCNIYIVVYYLILSETFNQFHKMMKYIPAYFQDLDLSSL